MNIIIGQILRKLIISWVTCKCLFILGITISIATTWCIALTNCQIACTGTDIYKERSWTSYYQSKFLPVSVGKVGNCTSIVPHWMRVMKKREKHISDLSIACQFSKKICLYLEFMINRRVRQFLGNDNLWRLIRHKEKEKNNYYLIENILLVIK